MGHDAGEHHRVREQDAPARSQHPVPVAQHRDAVRMWHIASFETTASKRSAANGRARLASTASNCTRVGQSARPREGDGVAHAMLVDVHAGHPAARAPGQVHRRAAGPAAYLEDLDPAPIPSWSAKREPFPGRQPAALAQILTVGRLPDRALRVAREVAVHVVVQVDGTVGHATSLSVGDRLLVVCDTGPRTTEAPTATPIKHIANRARGGYRLPARLTGVLLAAALTGCTRGSPAPTAETADDGMRRALGLALQAQGREAVAALRSIDTTGLAPRSVPIRRCMLERLDARLSPPMPVAEPLVAGVLSAYREYWLRSLRGEQPASDNEAWLLAALKDGTGATGQTLDDIETPLDSQITARGYHVLLGVTSPLRELMLWRTESAEHYRVALPETTESVTVVFMDGFASLGWAGFATCDRSHSGGWTKPDRLYAVRSAYDTTPRTSGSATWRTRRSTSPITGDFPELERQEELEYRAKLTEIALGVTSVYDLLEVFAGNVSADTSGPPQFRQRTSRARPAAALVRGFREHHAVAGGQRRGGE